MLARAVKKYGMAVRDTAGAVVFYAENPLSDGSNDPYSRQTVSSGAVLAASIRLAIPTATTVSAASRGKSSRPFRECSAMNGRDRHGGGRARADTAKPCLGVLQTHFAIAQGEIAPAGPGV